MASKIQNYSSRSGASSVAPDGVDQKQWSANPYANFDYRHTWWQKLWEGLGFRSKFDEYRDSMALNANEYEAQLAEKAHNEEFDSASAQAQRYREAGINPDINGDVGAGASSAMEPDPNAPISPGYDDPLQMVSGFANTIMSAFTGSIGLAKDALSLFQMRNDVESGNIGKSQSIVDYAMNMARQFIPESYPEGDADWVNRASQLAFDVGSAGLSKRQQRQFRSALNSFYQSAPTQAEQWKAWNESQTSKLEYFKRTSSKFFGDGTDEVLRIITDNLAKTTDQIFERGLRVENLSAQKEAEYLENVDTGLKAETENASNESMRSQRSIDGILNSSIEGIIKDLSSYSHSNKPGHQFASVALLVFSVLRMMNFSTSSGHVGGLQSGKTSIGF